MRDDAPGRGTVCQVASCRSAAETWWDWPVADPRRKPERVAVCGLHAAVLRAKRERGA